MPGFMGLPREVRDMIYEYCLVAEHTIQPYEESYNDSSEALEFPKPKLTLALTAVSRTIGFEAAQVLYGRNVWRITSATTVKKSEKSLQMRRPYLKTLWASRASFFRHVALTFSYHDTAHGLRLSEYPSELDEIEIPIYHHPRGLNDRHYNLKKLMVYARGFRLNIIKQMENISSITIDVGDLHCPTAPECCRLEQLENSYREVIFHLGTTDSDGVTYWPRCELIMIGVENEEEMDTLGLLEESESDSE